MCQSGRQGYLVGFKIHENRRQPDDSESATWAAPISSADRASNRQDGDDLVRPFNPPASVQSDRKWLRL